MLPGTPCHSCHSATTDCCRAAGRPSASFGGSWSPQVRGLGRSPWSFFSKKSVEASIIEKTDLFAEIWCSKHFCRWLSTFVWPNRACKYPSFCFKPPSVWNSGPLSACSWSVSRSWARHSSHSSFSRELISAALWCPRCGFCYSSWQ